MREETPEKIFKRLYVLMFEALDAMTSGKMLVEQRIPTFAFVLADRSTLPVEVKQRDDVFLKALFRNADDEQEMALKESKEFIQKMIPYPVICELPKDIDHRDHLLKECLNDTKANMYALVTEAIGSKSEYLNKDEFKPSLLHPDNIQQYMLISLRRKGREPVTMAAPITMNIIKRDGTMGRKIGEFKRYKWTDELPTDYDKNWK